MRSVKTVGDLMDVIAVYDRSLPLVFVSNEIGGYWPLKREPMAIGTDHSISHVDATRTGGGHSLQISLHKLERK